ncbi:insecticidal delta-endotoxin Cry8Ea1 family protein, partial [Bacillus thuringiensis]
MNSYQSENEYKILDTSKNTSTMSNRYPRYPQASIKNTTYKDWLNMCTKNQSNALQIPEATQISQGAISAAISISTSILGLLGVPFASQIGQLWQFTLEKLWPADNSQWEEFMRHVEELIDTKIETYARDTAISELKGLVNILRPYERSLENWKKHPTDTGLQKSVRDAFNLVNGFFKATMPKFAIRNYEVPLLTVYALAANMHLLLLRDSSIFGREWGLPQKDVDDNYCDQRAFANEYANHCTNWFNSGLQRLRGTNASSWIRYNRFRREMTLTVLDICSLFSNYDYYQYPIKVKSELTREIYTDPVGVATSTIPGLIPNWFDYAPSFNELELALIPSPRTVTWLNKITISTGRLNGWSTSQNYWQGHRLEYSETSAGNNIISPTYGDFNESVALHRDFSVLNRDVYTMDSYAVSQFFGISTATLFGVSDNDFQYQDLNSNRPGEISYTNPPSWGGLHIYSELPAKPTIPGIEPGRPTANDYSHRLTYLTASRAGTAGHVLCYGWTSSTVDRNNRIDYDKITQIPAVKGHSLQNHRPHAYTYVIKGNHTGGNLIRFLKTREAYNESTIGGGIRLHFYNSTAGQSYRIRFRYAADKAAYFSV